MARNAKHAVLADPLLDAAGLCNAVFGAPSPGRRAPSSEATYGVYRNGKLGKLRFPSFASARSHVLGIAREVRSQFRVSRVPNVAAEH